MLSETSGVYGEDQHKEYEVSHGTERKEVDLMPPYEPIAIIGCAVRLPGGVSTDDALWELLDQKREGRCRVPHDRYNVNAFYGPGKQGHVCTEYGHFLDHVRLDETDTSFWSMTRKEVEETDPQQRIALEVAYECLQSSGATKWKGRNIGSYWGIFGEDWADMKAKETQHSGMYRITGYGDFAVANRVSYELGIKGPSMVIRTACSSSLIGLHEACLGLHRDECDSAIVGGTNLLLNPHMTVAMSEQGVLSPGGRCMAFDEAADGYVRAEGIVAIHIKKLSNALRDNDSIRAVIRSSCTNSDGKTAGLSLPSSESHEALMLRSHELAGITDLSKTAAIECHGTGTQIGDPLEVMAVARAFGSSGIHIMSLKSNLGHSEGSAGVSSIIKAMLSLEHQSIPPNINFHKPNPKIPFEKYNLKVPVDTIPWPEGKAERIGVNSYGIGGANAHVLVESARSMGVSQPSGFSNAVQSHYLLTFSGANSAAVKQVAQDHELYLKSRPEAIADLSYTLNVRREPLPNRAFSVIQSQGEHAPPQSLSIVRVNAPYECVFVFTGQGAQWAEMGAELFDSQPVFRDTISRLEEVLKGLADPPSWSLKEELLKPAKTSRINLPEFAQPGCMAIQIAIVDVFRTWGVKPSGVVGHSGGETAGAYACGAITAAEAIKVAYYRGLATKDIASKGGMIAVGLGRANVTPYLQPGVIIGCENSPSSVTLTGDIDALSEVGATIKDVNPEVLVRALKVDCAYHSHHMSPMAPRFVVDQGIIHAKRPQVPFFSSVTASLLPESKPLSASYWAENLVSPVLFFPAVSAALESSQTPKVLLEIGPHAALAGPVRQIMKANPSAKTHYVSALVRNENANASLLNCAGTLFQRGVDLDFGAIIPKGRVLTDLPRYPWQREKHGSSESRLSIEWRQREHPKHDILGARVVEASDCNPTWRNLLRLDDVPWIRDHNVLDDIVFPGAGYVAMAGEAVRQLTKSEDFTIREMTISNALVMHEGAVAEVFTYLKPVRLTNTLDSAWYTFEISSLKSDRWVKHANGRVRGGSDYPLATPDIGPKSRQVDSTKWYTLMKRFGLNYGPRFRGLREVTADPLHQTAVARIDNIVEHKESPYPIHPCTLDFAVQLFMVAAPKGLARLFTNLALPTYIGELYIAPAHEEIAVEMKTTTTTKGSFWSNAVGSCGGRTVLHLRNLQLSQITDAEDSRGVNPHAAVDLVWKPDIDLVDNTALMRVERDMSRLSMIVERMTLACMIECSICLKGEEPAQPFLAKYRSWLNKVSGEAANGTFRNVSDCKAVAEMSSLDRCGLIENVHKQLSTTDIAPVATAIYRLFHSMEIIFSGRVDALEILLQDDTLTKVYDFGRVSDLRNFFVLAAHKKPNMRVLEIGAGTGGTTTKILEYLNPTTPYKERSYYSYTYTDVSPGFFAAAAKRFAVYDGLEFKVLDISLDPTEQGFEPASFDLIVASNVLHATPDLTQTLINVRKLLAQNGRLFLQELSPPIKWINFVMGTLPGWWLGSQDGRIEEPYIGPEEWQKHLWEAGFDGVDAMHHDGQFNANMIAKSVPKPVSKNLSLIVNDSTTANMGDIATCLEAEGYQVDLITFGDVPPAGQDIVVLIDIDEPMLHSITKPKYEALKRLILDSTDVGILWVTGASQVSCTDPRYSMILGLARTLRNETPADIATLELPSFDACGWAAIAKILPSFQRRAPDGDLKPNMEWAFANGAAQIPRFHWTSVNEALCVPESDAVECKLDIEKRGFLSSLYWKTCTARAPRGDEVQVRTRAVGLNFRDVMIAMGVLEGAEVEGNGLGSDAAGIVESVGSDVTQIKIGDRCIVLASGAFSTTITASEQVCIKIPNTLDLAQAASMPTIFCTAIHALVDLARVEKGQSVLIHSACGGVGLAAIQVCRILGADIFCTVGSDEKVNHLMRTFGIQRERIFSSRDLTFRRDVLAATAGRGVDVVLNSLSGEGLHASWQCVADFGCMVEIGKRDLIGKGALAMDLFESNRSYFGVDLARITAKRPGMVIRLLKKTMDLYEKGEIGPVAPITTFEAQRVDDAMRFMQKGTHIGKIILEVPQSIDRLPTRASKQRIRLQANASYLLVGGLGGLGQAIAVWMAEAGATELVFLSRSAGDKNKHASFVQELKILGCDTVLVAGSVADMAAVESAIGSATKPIRGVMQASMVLRDASFSIMTHAEFHIAISPKVQGTWNIHNAFIAHSIQLDFLILFSSWSGLVGQWGQANYAAANSFLDAFAQYRRNQGLSCATIDIGAMEDVGYVSERPELREHFRVTSTHVLYEQDLLDSLHLMITRAIPSAEEQLGETNGDAEEAVDWEFVSKGQLAIGLRSTLPLSSPSNRTVWKSDPRTALYRNTETQSNTTSTTSNDDPLKAFLAAATAEPALLDEKSSASLLAMEIGKTLFGFLMRDSESLDVTTSPRSLGVDSLVGIELRGWVRQRLGVEVSVLEILGSVSLEALGTIIGLKVKRRLGGEGSEGHGGKGEEEIQ